MSLTRFVTGAALVAALAAPLAASAQSAPPDWRHHNHHHRRNPYFRALRTLDLSDAQKKQIRAAFVQTRQADRAAIRANAEKMRGQVDAALTPAQREQLRTTLARERARHHHGMAGAPPTAP